MNALVLWFILSSAYLLNYAIWARRAARKSIVSLDETPDANAPERVEALEKRLAPMLSITGRKTFGKTFHFEGHSKGDERDLFGKIQQVSVDEGVTSMLLEGHDDEVRVVMLPGGQTPLPIERPNWRLHWILFLATMVTTTWAGALHVGVNLLQQPERFAIGLPYSLGLLLILGAHELGHYFTAKAYGIRVTPPYFIPVPMSLGTFGAFIKIKSLTPSRRMLFDVAAAGPLVGLLFAIPALMIGLRFSETSLGDVSTAMGPRGININSSVLLAFLSRLSLRNPVIEGQHLVLHPLAFAGWLGLIVTALNLLPIGQLDGGHISHALFGSRKSHSLSLVGLFALFFLALFVWPGLMFWAFIVFFIAGTKDTPAADDITPVGPGRTALGYLMFILLLSIILPVPHSFYEVIGLHSPYL